MAIETRVHNLWNHLIESASPKTGSLLIWDTGTYSVLPRKKTANRPPSPQTTDDGNDSSDSEPDTAAIRPSKRSDAKHENEKLIEAFQTRYVRLRLHGTRLPKNYTVTLRLPSANDFAKRRPPARRKSRQESHQMQAQPPPSTDSEPDDIHPTRQEREESGDLDTDSEEDAQTRLNNAYPGSTNSIGSVHQRQWFMLLDRASSGFVQEGQTGTWASREGEGFEAFYVRGRDVERSVVTGRLGREVECDEGVEGFVGRGGWAGIER